MLDFELELGFVTSDANALGERIGVQQARERIFGVVLVNDWSARDIQGWEYQPLGPFLGKSFATSLAPWVVPLEALEPYRVAGPLQEPAPLDYLATGEPRNYDIALEVTLASARMRDARTPPFCDRAHQLRRHVLEYAATASAHASSNGATVRAGDLFASGTISGPEAGSYGSMIELTWRGTQPFALPDGTQRAFLEDGDCVTTTGWCGDGVTAPRIGLGEVCGTIEPAR